MTSAAKAETPGGGRRERWVCSECGDILVIEAKRLPKVCENCHSRLPFRRVDSAQPLAEQRPIAVAPPAFPSGVSPSPPPFGLLEAGDFIYHAPECALAKGEDECSCGTSALWDRAYERYREAYNRAAHEKARAEAAEDSLKTLREALSAAVTRENDLKAKLAEAEKDVLDAIDYLEDADREEEAVLLKKRQEARRAQEAVGPTEGGEGAKRGRPSR